MTPGDASTVRHCAACDRQVYSLSEMTAFEAELRLLNAADVVPCIRYRRDEAGEVVHLLPYVTSPARAASRPGVSARALVVASALGTGLLTRDAEAKDKKPPEEPVQCVMLTPPPAPAAAAPSPAASGSAGAAAPAAPAAPAATTAAPPPMMGGAAPPPQHAIAYGTLTIKSKTPRDVKLSGLSLKAPLVGFRVTPGAFSLEITEPSAKKPRTLRVTIKENQVTILDLDKR